MCIRDSNTIDNFIKLRITFYLMINFGGRALYNLSLIHICIMIPIISNQKLEKVFLDICGPFPRSGGRHRFRFIVIIFDHFTKYTKLYSINRATTKKIIEIIITKFIPELGKPMAIITDHGTQFKGNQWKNKLWEHGIKTYKTSVYHPSSNPAERVLREVGRILRTYCHDKQREWLN